MTEVQKHEEQEVERDEEGVEQEEEVKITPAP